MSRVKRGKFTERKLHISLNAEFLTNKCDAFIFLDPYISEAPNVSITKVHCDM